jgi:hypothetical protein
LSYIEIQKKEGRVAMRAMSRLLQIHGSATSLDVDVVEHETKLRGAKKPWNHNTFWR